MEVSLILRKYKVTIADDSVPAQDLINFELLDHWDLSSDLMGEVVITRQLESDTVFNFAVSSVALTVSGNETLTTEFTRTNLEEYIYEVQIYGDEVRKFIGQVDSTNIKYDPDSQIWEFRGKDWYKFFYDTLGTVAWNYLGGSLATYLNSTFGIGGGKFLNFLYVDTPSSDPYADNWTNADTDVENLQTYKLLSRTDFLGEVIKHYGGFIYIDSDYRLNFRNRSRTSPPVTAYPINDLILDMTTFKTYLRDSYYDGVLVSQKTMLSPTLSEISWKLLRHIGGELVVTTITDPDQLSTLKGVRVLDIRQKLGAIASGTLPDVTYTWGYRMGYKIFPQRDYEETLMDYQDLFRRPVILETEIDYSTDITLLGYIIHNDGSGSVEYQVEYMEEDLISEKMFIRAKEYFSNNVLP